MKQEEYISIGKIVNTHGHKGEIKILPLTDFPERFFKMDKVLVFEKEKNTLKEFQIENARQHKQAIILKLKEILDMNEAEKLKGSFLQVKKEDLVELPKDHFYIFEIIGVKVFEVTRGYLGVLKDVIQTGANDVYVIEPKEGKPILIPALKKVVKEINILEGNMMVEWEEDE